jgi:hypothetical protein
MPDHPRFRPGRTTTGPPFAGPVSRQIRMSGQSSRPQKEDFLETPSALVRKLWRRAVARASLTRPQPAWQTASVPSPIQTTQASRCATCDSPATAQCRGEHCDHYLALATFVMP